MGRKPLTSQPTPQPIRISKIEVAELIGLTRSELLGPGSIVLSLKTVEKLKADRQDAELGTTDVGLILGVSRQQVTRYASEEDRQIRLAHRRRLGTQILVCVADLVVFIEAMNAPTPVPLTQAEKKRYEREALRIGDECRRRHNMPPRSKVNDENK
jgi:hypothetical protein